MSFRRRAIGAEPTDGGVAFRVWAPRASRIAVTIDETDHALEAEGNGYFSGVVASAKAGTRYRFRVDRSSDTYPDPASRYQPEGPHGPSVVVDPSTYRWGDGAWKGRSISGSVITEIHVGTLTPEGTYAAAIERLDDIANVGINVIELMPVNEFAGRFGWGYDGVDLFAPTRLYGAPDDLRRFVDAAHQRGLAVILDVVYNHLGPDGCYLTRFATGYFTDRYNNEWGEAVNFDGESSAPVREFFVENAAYWIDEFHLDGLRVDATQAIHDRSERHILREINDASRRAAGDRKIILIAENEPQDNRLLREHGFDAMWNDDWHHAASVALTGRAEAYYSDYRGKPQEFVSMARLGFLFQGQHYRWQQQPRGTLSVGLAAQAFVCYLQNHDQIANSMRGGRIHELAARGELHAMTALLLLAPQTPMLFQGQEFAASSPFLYFADHERDLAEKVAAGRREFLQQFDSIAASGDELPLPHDPRVFERCKLDWTERAANEHVVALHRDLLTLRREDKAFASQSKASMEGAVLAERCFVLRWFLGGSDDRLLVINLGAEFLLDPIAEPILAPPAGSKRWRTLWSSEAPKYGGQGAPEIETDPGWRIKGQSATVLRPASRSVHHRATEITE